MSYREFHFCWEYDLKSTPEQLWPFVADTNRFNRDTGVPAVEPTENRRLRNARRRLRLSLYGMTVEWEEKPFEWVRPSRFGVMRTYSKGPTAELRARAELTPRAEGGTKLKYELWIRPNSFLGVILVLLQIKFVSSRRFGGAFSRYDSLASAGAPAPIEGPVIQLSPAELNRLLTAKEKLVSDLADSAVVDRLLNFIQRADDFAVSRIRPYELADLWRVPRRAVLETCLHATRVGLLDLQWDLLCPLCRSPKESPTSLQEIDSQVHCQTCRIDFRVNFDRFVEVTFRPNSAVRRVDVTEFCVGSPQRAPHVAVQQLLPARGSRTLDLPLEEGRYRLRTLELPGEQSVTVSAHGAQSAAARVEETGWAPSELTLATRSMLHLENATATEQLFILERLAWSDQAATAAEVTALQVFRDLFSSEALRPGEQMSVGALTVLFTDLRNSTRLYREIGDATAFGRVLNHFDVLKQAIAEEDGALVKTIGDAVMAIFRQPANGLRAMLKAQQILAAPPDGSLPLTLKAGLHSGPCIAVTLNDRLDYFGSTVNMAARLESLSTGNDVVVSRAVYEDPEVRKLIEEPHFPITATSFAVPLKGFDEERFELWRVGRSEIPQERG